MTIIIAAVLGVILVCVIIVVVLRNMVTQQRHGRTVGVAYIQSLKDLLAHIQRHRGRTTRFLGGDSTQFQSIEQVQRDISICVQSLERIPGDLAENSIWLELTQHWSRLSSNYRRLDAENNISQHTALIRSIFVLIEEVAANYGLRKVRIGNRVFTQAQWQEVLVAAEYLGQLRAVGSNLLSSDYAPLAARRRVLSLFSKVEESCEIVWKEDEVDSALCRRSLESLNQLVKVDLQRDYPNIDPEHYFSLCTVIMDYLFERYDQIMEQYN